MQLVQHQLDPQLGRLVLDDEQHLVVGVGARVLGAEDVVEAEVLGVAEVVAQVEVGVGRAGRLAHRRNDRPHASRGTGAAPRPAGGPRRTARS